MRKSDSLNCVDGKKIRTANFDLLRLMMFCDLPTEKKVSWKVFFSTDYHEKGVESESLLIIQDHRYFQPFFWLVIILSNFLFGKGFTPIGWLHLLIKL